MTPQEKLTEVFNRHAGKVISMGYFEILFEKELEKRLSRKEIKTYRAGKKLFQTFVPDDTAIAALKQKTMDGSMGLWVSGWGDIAVSSYLMEKYTDLQRVDPSIQEKVTEVFVQVFAKVDDSAGAVRNGYFKPVRL